MELQESLGQRAGLSLARELTLTNGTETSIHLALATVLGNQAVIMEALAKLLEPSPTTKCITDDNQPIPW